MRKIKDGEYFRTHDGRIGKIRRFLEKDPCFYNMNYYMTDILYRMPGCYLSYRIYEDMITKHGSNIIDLIEENDYVNGYPVRKINGVLCNFDLNNMKWTPLKEIDVWGDIATHEQFNSIKYEVYR